MTRRNPEMMFWLLLLALFGLAALLFWYVVADASAQSADDTSFEFAYGLDWSESNRHYFVWIEGNNPNGYAQIDYLNGVWVVDKEMTGGWPYNVVALYTQQSLNNALDMGVAQAYANTGGKAENYAAYANFLAFVKGFPLNQLPNPFVPNNGEQPVQMWQSFAPMVGG